MTKNGAVNEKQAKPLPKEKAALFDTSEIRDHDPAWYASVKKSLLRRFGNRDITALQFNQAHEALDKVCRASLNCTLEEASRQQANIFERISGHILEALPRDLKLLEEEFGRLDALDDEVKKKCRRLLRRLIKLQREALKDPIKAMLYVMRDAEEVPLHRRDSQGNGVFHLEWFHVAFLRAMMQTAKRKVLIMAPPGHGKTTCLRWYVANKLATEGRRRILALYDRDDKPPKEGSLLQTIILSGRYKALYPEVRILGRKERREKSGKRFATSGLSPLSREPSWEGYAIMANFQGSGYDDLICDDMCPPKVRWEQWLRKEVNRRFEQVAQNRLRRPATAKITMIATPWHDDDAHGRIREKARSGDLEGWLILIDPFAIMDDAHGIAKPLWDGRFGSRFLQQRKVAEGAGYNCSFRLRSSTVEEKTLSRIWFYNSEPDGEFTNDLDRKRLDILSQCERWLSIDPSATGNIGSSDNGVVEFRWTPNDYLYVSEVWFKHLGAVAMQDWLMRTLYHAEPRYTGVHIEAQGAMKGQVSLWVSQVSENLREGRIPVGDGDDRQIMKLDPYKDELPRFVQTGTRMGGVGQQVGKVARYTESSPMLQNRWVIFAGRKIEAVGRGGTPCFKCEAIPESTMARLERILLRFDGTTESDAIDATTQFILANRGRMKNPNATVFAGPRQAAKEDPLTALRKEQYDKIKKQLAERGRGGDAAEEMQFYAGMVG